MSEAIFIFFRGTPHSDAYTLVALQVTAHSPLTTQSRDFGLSTFVSLHDKVHTPPGQGIPNSVLHALVDHQGDAHSPLVTWMLGRLQRVVVVLYRASLRHFAACCQRLCFATFTSASSFLAIPYRFTSASSTHKIVLLSPWSPSSSKPNCEASSNYSKNTHT